MRLSLSLCVVSLAALALACGTPSPASFEFVEVTPTAPRIGEITTIKFRAVDSRGIPMAGVPVSFQLQSEKPGITLAPALGSTNKGDGIAQVQVTATTRASSVVVVATAGDKSAQSPPLTFAGTTPSADQFTFQCGSIAAAASGGIHAIGAYDETRHLIAGVKVNCYAHVADRNGDGISGVSVSFLSEAGAIGPTETTQTDVIGDAEILYKSSLPFPKDVAPAAFSWNPPNDAVHTGELLAPLWMHPFEWRQNPIAQYGQPANLQEPRRADPIRPGLTLNPRDNLVSLIAFTTGEEGYDDKNNNGKYDNGEPFDDLTEPFVDYDDNGTWDADERWVDVNGNGVWDGKNGTHDASTLIWVQERILWTGVPHDRDTRGAEPVFRIIEPTAAINLGHYHQLRFTFLLSDPWFNTIAQNGDSDGCHTVGAEDKPLVNMLPSIVNEGMRFTYPAVDYVTFFVKDAHDPFANPPDPPHRNPVTNAVEPLPFNIPLMCTFTASPEPFSAHVTNVAVGTISGQVL